MTLIFPRVPIVFTLSIFEYEFIAQIKKKTKNT